MTPRMIDSHRILNSQNPTKTLTCGSELNLKEVEENESNLLCFKSPVTPGRYTLDERKQMFFDKFNFCCPEPCEKIMELTNCIPLYKEKPVLQMDRPRQNRYPVKRDSVLVSPVTNKPIVDTTAPSDDSRFEGLGVSSENTAELYQRPVPRLDNIEVLPQEEDEEDELKNPEVVFSQNIFEKTVDGVYAISNNVIEYLKSIPKDVMLKICEGLGNIAEQVKNLINFTVDTIVDRAADGIRRKVTSIFPNFVDSLVDVLGACFIGMVAGWPAGAASMTFLLVKWYGPTLFKQGEGVVLQGNETANPVWFAILGMGAVIAKAIGVQIDYRWLLATTSGLMLTNKIGSYLEDFLGFVSGVLPEAISQWIPLVLMKRKGSEEHYLLMHSILAMLETKKVTERDAFIRDYKKLEALSKRLEQPTRQLVITTLVKGYNYFHKCESDRGSECKRTPPYWVHFYGPPGIGKSTFITDIIDELVACDKFEVLRNVHPSELKYARGTTDEYWSGYKGQPIVTYDDLWQSTGPMSDVHANELINQVSPEPFPLNMAGLSDAEVGIKGTKYSSHFILSTGNVACGNNLKLAQPNALRRRMYYCIKVVVDPRCVNQERGIMSMEKVYEHYGNDAKMLNTFKPHLSFQLVNILKGDESLMVNKSFSFVEIMKIIIAGGVEWFESANCARERERLFGENGILRKCQINHGPEEKGHTCTSKDCVKCSDEAYLFSKRCPDDKIVTPVEDDFFSDITVIEDTINQKVVKEYHKSSTCVCLEGIECIDCKRQKLFVCSLYEMYGHLKYVEKQSDLVNFTYDNCLATVLGHIKDGKVISNNQYFAYLCTTMPFFSDTFSYSNKDKVPCLFCTARNEIFKVVKNNEDREHIIENLKDLIAGELKPIDHATSKLSEDFNFRFVQTKYLYIPENDETEKFWMSIAKAICRVALLVGSLYLGFKSVSYIYNNVPSLKTGLTSLASYGAGLRAATAKEFSFDDLHAYEPGIAKRAGAKSKLAEFVEHSKLLTTPSLQASHNDIVMNCAIQHLASLTIVRNGVETRVGSCILLNSRNILILKHYVEDIIHGGVQTFRIGIQRPTSNGNIKYIDVNIKNLLRDSRCYFYNSDSCVIRLDSDLPSVTNISHHWVQDPYKVNTKGAFVLGFSKTGETKSEPVLWVTSVADCTYYEMGTRAYKLAGHEWDVSCWRYSCPIGTFIRGNCGAILVFPNNTTGWFGGFHRAENPSVPAYKWCEYESQSITESTIKEYLGVIIQQDELDILVTKSKPLLNVVNQDLTFVGYLEQPVRLAETSQLIESPLHPKNFALEGVEIPFHPSMKEPAILNTKDPRHKQLRSPISLALDKYKEPLEYDVKVLDIAESWLIQDVNKLQTSDVFCRVLTEDEAINGIAGVSYIDNLDMTTSPGLPYTQYRVGKGKEFLFSGEPGSRVVSDPILRERIDTRIRLGKLGERMTNSIWSDSLKDEKLKKDKIELSKTRLFNIAPVDHLIVCKMYLGAFLKYLQDNQRTSFTGIGINAESFEWTELMEYLKNDDPTYTGHDGDWKEYDGRNPYQMYYRLIKVTNEWYTKYSGYDLSTWKGRMQLEEDNNVRRSLLIEAFSPYECALDVVFTKDFGMPSGWLGTAAYNCLINYLLGACFFIEEVNSDKVLWDLVKKKYYGDDNLYSYPITLQPYFNGKRMEEYFARHGQIYTPALKDGVWRQQKPCECSYLKRNSKKVQIGNGVVYLPLIDKISVNEAINWTKVGDDLWANVEEQVMNVSISLAMHGRSTYNKYKEVITLGAYNAKRDINMKSYEEIWRSLCEPNVTNPKFNSEWYESFMNAPELQSGVDVVTGSGTSLTVNTATGSGEQDLGSRSSPIVKVAENPVTYENIVYKWSVLPRFEWNQSAIRGDVLLTRNVPMELISNNQVLNAFQSNSIVRLDAEVSVRISATRFHQGILLTGFVPGITREMFAAKYQGNIVGLMNLPNKNLLFANGGEQVIVHCPYFAKYNYIRQEEYGDDTIRGSIGVFYLAVLSPLKASTGAASSVPVLMSSRFKAEFHFPKPVLQGWFEDMFSAAKRTTSKIVTTIEGAHKLVETGKDALDVMAAMDRGPVPYMNGAFRATNGNLGCIDLPFPSEILTLESRGISPTQLEHFCKKEDEMNLKYLLGIENYLTQFEWSTGDVNGTLLYSNLITPTLHMCKHGSLSAYQPTSIDYLCAMFGRWRCDLRIGIHFSATSFAAGTLRISVLQGYFEDTIPSINDTTSQAFASLDLSEGKKSYYTVIPYNTVSNTKSVLYKPIASYAGTDVRQEFGNGMFYFHVENPLTVGGDAPTTVEVTLTYSLINPCLFDIPPVTWENFLQVPQLQSGSDIILSAGTQREEIVDNTVPVLSLRDMVRRFTYGTYENLNNGFLSMIKPYYSLVSELELGTIVNCYAGVRGGLYFKVSCSTSSAAWNLYWDPSAGDFNDYGVGDSSGGMRHSIMCYQQSTGLTSDITVPFTSNYSFVSTSAAIGNNGGSVGPLIDLNAGALVVTQVPSTTGTLATGVGYRYYIAGGDDFRCAGWMGPPLSIIVYRN